MTMTELSLDILYYTDQFVVFCGVMRCMCCFLRCNVRSILFYSVLSGVVCRGYIEQVATPGNGDRRTSLDTTRPICAAGKWSGGTAHNMFRMTSVSRGSTPRQTVT